MKTKNNIFLKLVSIFLILTPSVFSQTTGEHVEGGGDGLPTKIRQGRVKIISVFKNVTVEDLERAGTPEKTIALFNQYALPLAQDLTNSEYKMYHRFPHDESLLVSEEGDSVTKDFFILDGVVKTFKTSHEPFASIYVNLPRCEELNVDANAASALFAREGRRHIESNNESKESDLKNIEDMALFVLQVYDVSLSQVPQTGMDEGSSSFTPLEERIVWTTFMYLKTFYPNVFPESIPLRFFVRELLDGLTADHIMTGKLIHRNYGPIEQPSKDFIELQFTDYLKTMGWEVKVFQYAPPFSQYFDEPLSEVLRKNITEGHFIYNKDFIYDDIPEFSDDNTRNKFLEALEIIKKLLISRDVRFEPGWHNKLLVDFLPLQSLNTTFKTSLEDIYDDVLSKKLVVAIEDLSHETAASLAEKIATSPVAGENQRRPVVIIANRFTKEKAHDFFVVLRDAFNKHGVYQNLDYANFLEQVPSQIVSTHTDNDWDGKATWGLTLDISNSIRLTTQDRVFMTFSKSDAYDIYFDLHIRSYSSIKDLYLDLWNRAIPYRSPALKNGPIRTDNPFPHTDEPCSFYTFDMRKILEHQGSLIVPRVGSAIHSKLKNVLRMKKEEGHTLSRLENATMDVENNFSPMSFVMLANTREEGEEKNQLIMKEVISEAGQFAVTFDGVTMNMALIMAGGMGFIFDQLPGELINAYRSNSILERYETSLLAIVDPIKGIVYTFGDAAYQLFHLDPARTLHALCRIPTEASHLGLTVAAKVIRLPLDVGKSIYHGFQWLFSSEDQENTCPSINWSNPPFEHVSPQQMVEKMYMDFVKTSHSERTVAYMEDQLKQLRNTLEAAAEKELAYER